VKGIEEVPDKFILADILASGVHDVKNNLFSAETQLLSGNVNSEAACFMIRLASIRLSKMLSAYHLLRHDLKLPMDMVNVPNLIEDAVLQAKASSSRKIKVEINQVFGEDWLLAREEINDVLVNALQNADRYAREKIEICTYLEDQKLIIEVHDDGSGFPKDLKISKPDAQGHGLGLFIASQIAAHHKRQHREQAVEGTVWLGKSARLGGGQFTLRLP
jgi:signal transduction histidine kinase